MSPVLKTPPNWQFKIVARPYIRGCIFFLNVYYTVYKTKKYLKPDIPDFYDIEERKNRE